MPLITRILAAVLSALILGALALVWNLLMETRDKFSWFTTLKGAVIAFDSPQGCPEGWSEFSESRGLVIVGTGEAYPYRQTGGEEEISLTDKHIPFHQHPYMDIYHSENPASRPPDAVKLDIPDRKGVSASVDNDNAGWAVGRLTGAFGREEDERSRHTNMPPYIALHFCMRD